jgi:hypothetical protein
MRRLPLLAACTVAALAALAPGPALADGHPGASVQAQVANFPAWRLVWKGPDSGLHGLAAISAKDAWATGINGHAQGYLLRWNGHRWRTVALPVKGFLPTALQASSATNIWLFGDIGGPAAFRSDGSHWHRVAEPADGLCGPYLILSRTDVWAEGGPACGQLEHLHGSTWTAISLPGNFSLTSLSGSSDTSIWVAGHLDSRSGTGPIAAYRWTGRSWSRAHLARMGQGATAQVVAVSPANVWVVNTWVWYPRPAHWNGKTWTSEPPPPSALDAAVPVVPYGRYGIRVGATSIWTGRRWLFGAAPNDGANALLSAIPGGSTAAWMAGSALLPHTGLTAELLYSP